MPVKTNKELTFLQVLTNSSLYESVNLSIIMLNCWALAMVNPLVDDDSQAPYLFFLNWFFNIVYVGDVILRMVAWGLQIYFLDSWHYLDFLVGMVSVIEILLAVFSAIGMFLGLGKLPTSSNLNSMLNIMQILRVLRPLKALSFMTSLMAYLEACFKSIRACIINLGFVVFALASISVLTNYLIGDSLRQRCVPDINNLTAAVTTDPDYIAWGEQYYYTKYNDRFCGKNSPCEDGFLCEMLDNLAFETSSADYGSPWYVDLRRLICVSLDLKRLLLCSAGILCIAEWCVRKP